MNLTTVSKFLAMVLRHKPEEVGLTLDRQGWCDTEKLVEAFSKKFEGFTMKDLEEIVSTDNKGRYAFNEDKTLIRAVQGHSVKCVDLDFEEVDWDTVKGKLVHGTGEKYVENILKQGLIPKSRQYVHLSADKSTAVKVGQRHGKPVLFKIDTDGMKQAGYKLFKSENNVYLVKEVPAKYLEIIE